LIGRSREISLCQNPNFQLVWVYIAGTALAVGAGITVYNLTKDDELATGLVDGMAPATTQEEKKKKEAPYPYPGNNPATSPGEDWKWRGKGEPGSKEGGWYNEKTDEGLRSDLNHPNHKPHWDYHNSEGEKGRIYEDGTYEIKNK
jgi:hypothetical protein